MNRRIRKLTIPVDIDIDIDTSSNIYELAIDSTGYKISNRGDWIRESGRRGKDT